MKLYFTKPLLIILCLGMASGLPLALTASTLFAWLAEAGVQTETIGLFASIALPYSLKFLWSPLVDSVEIPLLGKALGRRRSWLLTLQIFLVLAMMLMASGNPAEAPFYFALMGCAIAFFSASQDIVIDAYRVESVPIEQQGAAAAMITLGYRLAMLVSGAGALWLSDHVSWHLTYLVMAGIMAGLAVMTLVMPEPVVSRQSSVVSIKAAVIEPFRDFMQREGWLMILLFVILFKLGDAFLGVMFNPFLLELGFTKTDIAAIVKLYGLLATIGGSFLGGWLVSRYGVYRILLLTGFWHMLTNLLLVLLAGMGPDKLFLALCVISENLTAGMGSAAFVAYLSALCRREYTATQYALLSSLASVARTLISAESGMAAAWLGWQGFFLFSSLLAIPSLILLWWMEQRRKKMI
jgi:PAT family beta-lactamase induction signal transducer AmpG